MPALASNNALPRRQVGSGDVSLCWFVTGPAVAVRGVAGAFAPGQDEGGEALVGEHDVVQQPAVQKTQQRVGRGQDAGLEVVAHGHHPLGEAPVLVWWRWASDALACSYPQACISASSVSKL